MKCSDIPDLPILAHIAKIEESFSLGANWAALSVPADEWQWRSVRNAMPEGTGEKVILAKMRVLIRNGLVQGCCCGCRGDFTLTEKGIQRLAAPYSEAPAKEKS